MSVLYEQMSNSSPDDWYAVYTRHQHEKSVAENLAGRELEVFFPVYEAVRQWTDRQKGLSLPLFPCYVFFRGSAARRARVISTPGVHSIVGFGGRPTPIDKSQVDAVRLAIENHFRVEPHPFLRYGDRVRVKSGSLSGVEGILLRKRGLARLIISAELLQKSVSIEVDAAAVERIARGTGDDARAVN